MYYLYSLQFEYGWHAPPKGTYIEILVPSWEVGPLRGGVYWEVLELLGALLLEGIKVFLFWDPGYFLCEVYFKESEPTSSLLSGFLFDDVTSSSHKHYCHNVMQPTESSLELSQCPHHTLELLELWVK